MTTMITFEYLIQLCQNKEQMCPLNGVKDAPGTNTHHHQSPAPVTISLHAQCDVMW